MSGEKDAGYLMYNAKVCMCDVRRARGTNPGRPENCRCSGCAYGLGDEFECQEEGVIAVRSANWRDAKHSGGYPRHQG